MAASRPLPPICLAWASLGLGDPEATLDYLEQAYAGHDAQLESNVYYRSSKARAAACISRITELADSIRGVGLLQPIIVRPFAVNGTKYEIVAGERRFRAMKMLAETYDIPDPKITAIIKEMDHAEAFMANVVENLQREDVTEQEEATAMAFFAETFGEGAIEELALKLGVSERYVRKRIQIMSLPKSIIWGWKHDILCYGHLEQFLRMSDRKEQLLYFKRIYKHRDDRWDAITVKRMSPTILNHHKRRFMAARVTRPAGGDKRHWRCGF